MKGNALRRAAVLTIPALVALAAALLWPPERLSPYLAPILTPILPLEWNGYDAFFHWRGPRPDRIDPRIAVIGFENGSKRLLVDGQSLKWPPPRRFHAAVVRNLTRDRAKAILFDVLMEDASPDPNDDREFAAALADAARAGVKVTLACRVERSASESSKSLVTPFHEDKTGVDFEKDAEIAFVDVTLDSDGVVRRIYPLQKFQSQWLPSLPSAAFLNLTGRDIAASALTPETIFVGGAPIPRTGPDVPDPLDPENRMGTAYVDFSAGLSMFPLIRYESVYRGDFPKGRFTGKAVFIGVAGVELTQAQNDYFKTAYSRFTVERMGGQTTRDVYGVVVQAQMLNALLQKTFLRHAYSYEIFVLVFAFCSLGTFGVRRYMNWRGPAIMIVSLSGYVAVAFLLFAAQGIYVPYVLPGILMMLSIAAVAYFGRTELRRKWAAHVSPAYLEAMLRTGDETRPERLEATVLFGDIRGFTRFSEQHRPETVVSLLDKHLEKMVSITLDEAGMEGAVDKFLGDGILAVFGAPRLSGQSFSQENNALRAVRAACRMQEAALQPLKDDTGAEYVLATGFGITTGPLLLGHVGLGRLKTFTLIGDTVNFASRLQGVTGQPDVLIDAATYELVKTWVEVEPLHDVRVKGKEDAFTCYLVKRLRA